MDGSFSSMRAIVGVAAAMSLAACLPGRPTYVTLPAGMAMNNADSLRTAWGALPLGVSKQFMRRGKDCNGCMVPIEISAVAGEQTFDPSNPPTAPQAVARVVNRGGVETEMYGFKPNADEYFVVANDGTGQPVWSIVNIPRAAHGVATVRKGYKVKGCGHPRATNADAAFQTCKGKTHSFKPASLTQLAARGTDWIVAGILRLYEEDPAWVACTDGCCTLNAT